MRTSELACDGAKKLKNRSTSVKRAQSLLRGRPGASRDWPRKAFGRFLNALGPPRAPQDRSLGDFSALQCPPQHVLAPSPERSRASQGAPERPRANLVDLLSILGLPWPLWTSMFGFSSTLFERSCRRRWFAFGVSKKSRAIQPSILARALYGCLVLHARLSKTHCLFFSMRTYKCT